MESRRTYNVKIYVFPTDIIMVSMLKMGYKYLLGSNIYVVFQHEFNNCLLTETLIVDFCPASSLRKLSVIAFDANLDAEYGPTPGSWPILWEATLEKTKI